MMDTGGSSFAVGWMDNARYLAENNSSAAATQMFPGPSNFIFRHKASSPAGFDLIKFSIIIAGATEQVVLSEKLFILYERSQMCTIDT